jgi:hypothetical protein
LGKPYRTELAALPATYDWARSCSIDALAGVLRSARSTPLLCVGSGGSLSVAHLAARLHQERFGHLARATTPLESVSCRLDWRELSVLILTAGGGNPDVLGAFEFFRRAEVHALGVVCCRPDSPLAERATEDRLVHSQTLALPSGKDGFLATNTLLASAVALWRGFAAESRIAGTLPDVLEELVSPGESLEAFVSRLRSECGPLWTCSTLVVLHGPSTEPAVVDIESKLVEAGLASVLPADYRNFAHGRHNWLARHGDETAVLALASEADRALCARTLRLLPPEVPRAIIEFEGGVTLCSLASLITSLYLAGLAGETKGIDPGAPQVPEFGRKLYHLNAYSTRKAGEAARLEERAKVAIERKSRMSFAELQRLEIFEEWRGSYDRFVSALLSARFHALVLDFDGTICERRNRFVGITETMGTLLTRVLREDIVLGIASGRGKSVRDDLQRRIPRELWDRVVVGYYNGSDVGSLADDSLPDRSRPAHPTLVALDRLLRCDPRVQRLLTLPELRPMQLSIAAEGNLAAVWRALSDLLSTPEYCCLRAVRSSHSIDVLAPGTTKTSVLDHVRAHGRLAADELVLCIGDRGEYPGNDFELLREPCSLSVDEVSPDPRTCWNLAPWGCRGVSAAELYLRSVSFAGGTFGLPLDLAGGVDR